MATRAIKPAYARMDPAHLNDGLFIPTNGRKRGRLYVMPRDFGDRVISFQGYEQLGAGDQSVLLAISAQLGIDGLVIENEATGDISKQLRLDLEIKGGDTTAPLASKKTSLRSLLIDAGYKSDRDTREIKEALNRLSNCQIREQNKLTGWDRRSNLISVSFNSKTGETHIAANPRLTASVFKGQHVKVSLYERNELHTEVAKILHCWLCSNIRLGKALGNGNGARLDSLAPHVWGQAWDTESSKVKSTRRGLLREALDEIADRTRSLHRGYGWAIDQTSSGLVIVSRPKNMPAIEASDMRPSEDWIGQALRDSGLLQPWN